MDRFSLQPPAGASGELTGALIIRKYHKVNRELETRTEIIIPDSAHGTNPASARMAGFRVIEVPSDENGCVDIEALKSVLSRRTAGLMLTNPNTLGIFERNIVEIAKMVHEVGGLLYYDGANFNAIMGIVGSLALAMFIYGGFTWMTAAGASERVQKGKDILIWATVGLIVIFSSYALVYFILNNVIKGV